MVQSDWNDYQEEAAIFFRMLGISAETNVRLQGVRTTHDIDVVVKSVHVGFEVTWLVECKHWKTPISKLHVLGLRQIVLDLGADRGILLSESGFQAGATEAANLTNVQLTSLAALRESTKHQISAMRLRELFDRLEACSERYWDIPKAVRIQHGLRPGLFDDRWYSGEQMIAYCKDLLSQSMRGRYPIILESMQAYAYNLKREFSDLNEVMEVLEQVLVELEGRLASVPK